MMKRALLVLAATLMFFSTLAVPNLAHADGGGGATSCGGNSMCKP
jgi:hypothetical protein